MSLPARIARFVAALTLAGATTIGTAGQPAQAATAPSHVAIIVANVGSACVPWHSGMTGADVLQANFTVKWGGPPSYVGFVLRINGSGTDQPTLTRYWAYFHNTGGGWVYSGSGAAGYHPQPGTVEGWAFDDGQQSPPTPPSATYASICGGQDPVPPPTHPPTVAHHPSPPPAAQPGQPGLPGRPNPSTGSSTANGPATSSGAHSTAPASRRPSTARSTSGGVPADTSTSTGTQSAVHLVGAKQNDKKSSAAPALETGLALLAVALLGGAAFWRLRRQKLG